MHSENAFKLGSILLLVGFSVAGVNNFADSSLSVSKIHSESQRIELTKGTTSSDEKANNEIRKDIDDVQEINQLNVSEFAPYKIR